MDEWVSLDRMASLFKFKNSPNPILAQYSAKASLRAQYSITPTFQQTACDLFRDWAMRSCLVPAHPG
jgi:hypothetical protein